MSLIGSSSAQMLLLMLLPLFVFQQSSAAPTAPMPPTSQSCGDLNRMYEFNVDLKGLHDKVQSCPEDCSLAEASAECQCLNIDWPLKQSNFLCYYSESLKLLKERESLTFMNHFIGHLEIGCQCTSMNPFVCSKNRAPGSVKALVGQLKECVEEYNTMRSSK